MRDFCCKLIRATLLLKSYYFIPIGVCNSGIRLFYRDINLNYGYFIFAGFRYHVAVFDMWDSM